MIMAVYMLLTRNRRSEAFSEWAPWGSQLRSLAYPLLQLRDYEKAVESMRIWLLADLFEGVLAILLVCISMLKLLPVSRSGGWI